MLRFAALEDLGLAVAAMSDKSDGDCAHADTRRQVCQTAGASYERFTLLKQVHGDCVLPANTSHGSDPAGREGDGLVTDEGATPVGVLVADCVPVYLFDPVKRAGGIVHAGRAGTYSHIAQNAVRLLERNYGVQARDLHAFIGPSAGPCCYEVSVELAQAFKALGLPTSQRHLDLWEANVLQLEGCGVPRSQITVARLCTICDTRFHSHRRKPDGKRNLALLAL